MSLQQIAGIKIEKVKDSDGLYNLAEEISIVSPFLSNAIGPPNAASGPT